VTHYDRIALAAVLLSLAVLALYAGAELQAATGFIVGALLGGAGLALLLDPKDSP